MAKRDPRKLFCEIINCPEIPKAWKAHTNICAGLIYAQLINDFRVPEPWTRSLTKADVLYIAINPSIRIGKSEAPKWGTECDDVYRYFINGLSTRKGKWWTKLRNYTQELGDYNYAVTNVVHCKSPEVGYVTRKIRNFCCDMYLDNIIKCSYARVIVSIGKGRRGIERLYNIKPKEDGLIYKDIGDKKRLFAYLHRQRDPTSFSFNYSTKEINEIRNWLCAHTVRDD